MRASVVDRLAQLGRVILLGSSTLALATTGIWTLSPERVHAFDKWAVARHAERHDEDLSQAARLARDGRSEEALEL